MHRVLLVVVLAAACVNDYRVRGDESSSSSSGSTSTAGDTTTSTGGDTTQGGMGDTTHVGMGDATAGDFTCEPCTADDQCGDDWDLCVSLDEVGPHCLISCPEAGCPDGTTCRMVMSVDGVTLMQCSPGSSACVPELDTSSSTGS
ncbi:MAG TPA: hypothetical protein VG755_10010 [Nannocystaceae bacterium]|nr:hypothetical protein [Nannocystaceae bacterium]